MSSAELDPAPVEAAAEWFVRLSSGVVTAEERAAFERWRGANPDHDRAWARFEAIQQAMHAGNAPPALAASTVRVARRRLLERRRLLKGIAAFGAALPAAYLLRERSPLQHALADFRTGVGERRQFTLADGTQLWLNTGSAVDLRFDGRERRLLLRGGEIQVATAPDAADRPFVVATIDGELRPLGTRFTVRRYDDEAQTRLAVSAGAVEVRPRDSGARLRVDAGQSLRFDAARAAAPAPANGDDAWIDGMIGAERMRLEDFLAELSRHRRGLLRCDPTVADLRLTGTFPLADTDRVLAKLAETLPVSVHYRTRWWVAVTALVPPAKKGV